MIETILKESTSYKVAIYCRLSKDDEQGGDSTSIQNQRDMLVEYVKASGWSIYDIYIDDGYTGLNMERPAFQRMLEDIGKKRVNLVITKDLSRLGRNYLQTGEYTEKFFPKNGVRYIAVNDNVDTFYDNNEILPFKNILNEFYSRDISKKIKSSYLTRAKQGKFTGYAPLGYKKDPANPHSLIIDDETAWIVKEIFEYAKKGYGPKMINTEFRKRKIPCPSWWNRKKGLRNVYTNYEKTIEDGECIWELITIRRIIRNPVYLGHIASQKSVSHFKLGHLKYKPKEQWIVVENMHEPLVDEDTFRIANEKADSRKRVCKSGEENIFSGLVKCPDCGRGLKLSYNNARKKRRMFTCRTYAMYGKDACTHHKIFYDDLYAVVMADIKRNAHAALEDEKSVISALTRNALHKDKSHDALKQLESDRKRYRELELKIDRMYEDLLEGKISNTNFYKILEKTQQEQALIEQRIKDNEEKSFAMTTIENDINKWLNLIKKYKDIETLDKSMIYELIERIIVYEKIPQGDDYTQSIEIHYNFIGKNVDSQMSYNL